MALNSPMHEAYLNMPMEAQMLPELEGLPYWSRLVHEMLYELNPQLLNDLASKNELSSFLQKQQDNLSAESRKLAESWKKNNPLPPEANYFQRTSWMNHAKQSAREILIEELRKSLSLLADA